jgi:predicted ATPase
MSERAVTRIHVEGFRSLKNVDLEPGRVTVLIGPNGSGKSNFLSALRMLSLMRSQSLRAFVGSAGGASELLHYGPKTTPEISIRLELTRGAGAVAYHARLEYAATETFTFAEEATQSRAEGAASFGPPQSLGTGHLESHLDTVNPTDPASKVVRGWLKDTSFLHFHDTSVESALRRNARQAGAGTLQPDGANLAAFLYALATSDARDSEVAWRRINSLVQRVAPFIKTLSPTLVVPHDPTSGVRLNWIDERDTTFGPDALSDGTLRCIALFTALAQPTAALPAFMVIDEPELGLHPSALRLLGALVSSVSAHSQILVATQSPTLLDQFDASEVVVCERARGETSFRRLNPAELSAWLEDYALSELYEKNVLGGQP